MKPQCGNCTDFTVFFPKKRDSRSTEFSSWTVNFSGFILIYSCLQHQKVELIVLLEVQHGESQS